MTGPLRADLHVHSWHSGFTRSMAMFRSRDCYSTPGEIYRAAKSRGMDVVTITDHDSIDGCLEFLSRHPGAPELPPGASPELPTPEPGPEIPAPPPGPEIIPDPSPNPIAPPPPPQM